jgi:hypothetical protein
MFGWIEGVFGRVGNAISGAVKDFVHLLIRGVYGFLHDVFHMVWNAWNFFWNATVMLWKGARAFSIAVYHGFIRLFKIIIPWLTNYIRWVYHTVVHLVYVLIQQLTAIVTHNYHLMLSIFDAFRKWVINSIWNPLFKSLTNAWHWLTHEGATMWHFFTNLAAFAELLFWHILHSLESHAWDAGKFLGDFFLALVVHNIVRFATLIESVIDAVL